MVRKNEVIAASWEKGISNMYKTTKYDRLRRFSFKLLYLILITNKKRKRYEVNNNSECHVSVTKRDSLEQTFIESTSSLKLYGDIWIGLMHNTTQLWPHCRLDIAELLSVVTFVKFVFVHKNLIAPAAMEKKIYANKSLK